MKTVGRECPSTRESLLIMRIITEQEKLDLEIGIDMVRDVAGGHGDGFKAHLRIEAEIGPQGFRQFADWVRPEFQNDVHVLRGPFNTVDIAGKRTHHHKGDIALLQGGNDLCDDCI